MENTKNQLLKFAQDAGVSVLSQKFALYLDSKDELRSQREFFLIPKIGTLPFGEENFSEIFLISKVFFIAVDHFLIDPAEESIYLCGNSLGLQPKTMKPLIDAELKKWAEM